MIEYFIAILIAFIGLTLHWLKKWLRKQTGDSFFKYITVNPGHSLSSIITTIGAATTIMANSGVDFSNSMTISTLLLAGYSMDSITNKGSD